MRVAAAVASVLLLAACAGPAAPAHAPSPSPSAGPSAAPSPLPSPSLSASPAPSPAPSATPTPAPAAASFTCTAPIAAGRNLVLATLAGSPQVVLRDITDTAAATTLCTFSEAIAPRFVTETSVAWAVQGLAAGAPGSIVRADLAAGTLSTVASWTSGGFGSGIFDWSPDGSALTYIGAASPGPTWHLVSGGGDHVLSTLPAVPGRGVDPQNDDFMVGFSPDGAYVAIAQSFATGGSGQTAPLQVRRVSDGSLVYSDATSFTMAVWASVPSRLFFRNRDRSGLTRWDPTTGASRMGAPLGGWVRPRSSPDGRWVAYMTYDSSTLPHVGLYSVQGDSLGPQPAGLRSAPVFLNNDLLWYQEEASTACGPGGCSQPTGRAFIYDIAGGTETVSRLSAVFDAWPRVTAPPGLG